MADELCTHFSTVANNIGAGYLQQDFECHPSVRVIRQAYQGLHFNFSRMKTETVERELHMLKPSKATGWDGISPKILKLTGKGIAPSLTRLFNTIIEKGQWPCTWKMGEWTPVFKKGDRTRDRCNYRPITVLNSIDKVFESLLCKQVTSTMDPHLYQKLSAYRKQHSCETTVLRLIEDWKAAADRKNCVTVLSTDMSKAFDSLHPVLMTEKLKAYGFSDKSVNLMQSFLGSRKNRVKLQDLKSVWKEQTRGCPQGSSFGPLLWNLFQNDLPSYTESENLFMYADDHQIYTIGDSIEIAAQELKEETEKITQWYKENLLKANPRKFQIIVIDPKSSKTEECVDEVSLKIDSRTVKSSDKITILGVNSDDKLTFSAHIKDISKRASKKVGVLLRLRNLIPCSAKLQLYKSGILPYLTYCDRSMAFL